MTATTSVRKYTNSENIPLALAVFLATDSYDHEENVISATTLLKPVRQVVLSSRVPKEDSLVDISGLIASRMGTALHDAIERSWAVDNYKRAMQQLGYPVKVIKQVRVNPTPEEEAEGGINVYLERRSYKQVGKWRVSAKFDFVGDGQVQDFKSTSVFTYMNQSNSDKYLQQGSIYRWLNPDIIHRDNMAIHYIFTDWSGAKARIEESYPKSRMISQTYQLMSIPETDAFVKHKLNLIEMYEDAPEPEIPLCTDEEVWRKPTIWKYYKNPEKTEGRSTNNFDSYHEAMQKYVSDGSVGVVKEFKGQVVACLYCAAFSLCSQAQAFVANGDLNLPSK